MQSDQTRMWAQSHGAFTCETCSSPLIQPLEWKQGGDDAWSVRVRCPECFQMRDLCLTTEQFHLFRNMLDEAAHNLAEVADMLDAQVFRETCERFTSLLRAGLVYPVDF